MTPFLELMLVLAVIVLGAKLAGWALGKLNQPTVVGEIAFGLLLGPTVFDLLGQPLFTHAAATGETIHMMAELGVVLLMFLAGLETDLGAMRRVGLPAISAAIGGVVLPFFGGWGFGVLVGLPINESIFIGTILTATSVSISAQTLLELKKLRTKEGMTILGAAVIDDVLGILMLSVVVALFATAGGPAPALWLVVVKMVAYFVIAVAIAPLARAFLKWFSRLPLNQPLTAAALVLVLVYSWSAEFLGGLAAITGAYLIGILLGNTEFKERLESVTQVFTYGFFVSIFFVDIGMRANLREALSGPLAWLGLAIIVIAIVGKVVGSGVGARLTGFSNNEALRVGTGMVSRGEVGLIVAAIGVERQVITPEIFSLMVLMVVVTTLITPMLLRLSFRAGPAAEG
ncbi:MAG TPA: cation:proton antiporter [Trueperaceae bacterium]|nr:cation:proton antiporter [Trueperaceae bacterium]